MGFKNGTDGGVQVAVDAMRAARSSHHFISITLQGHFHRWGDNRVRGDDEGRALAVAD